jgi:hypothetical protein
MRLAKHDELVEAMTEVIDEAFAGEYPLLSRQAAAAALDAMLKAVVRLEVGVVSEEAFIYGEVWTPLILRMEASDDK